MVLEILRIVTENIRITKFFSILADESDDFLIRNSLTQKHYFLFSNFDGPFSLKKTGGAHLWFSPKFRKNWGGPGPPGPLGDYIPAVCWSCSVIQKNQRQCKKNI